MRWKGITYEVKLFGWLAKNVMLHTYSKAEPIMPQGSIQCELMKDTGHVAIMNSVCELCHRCLPLPCLLLKQLSNHAEIHLKEFLKEHLNKCCFSLFFGYRYKLLYFIGHVLVICKLIIKLNLLQK